MAIYTFYPRLDGGAAATFQAFDLPHDGVAANQAIALLDQHRSCVAVEVWCGDRQLITRSRRVSAQLQPA